MFRVYDNIRFWQGSIILREQQVLINCKISIFIINYNIYELQK